MTPPLTPSRLSAARFLQAALFAVLVAAAPGCHRVPRGSGPLPQDAYLWQRAWTPAVRKAAAQGSPEIRTLVVFAGQLTLDANGGAKAVRPQIDYAALKAASRPVALAVRVSPYHGPFRRGDAAAMRIVAFARQCAAEMRSGGLGPTEFQIDFDCAESALNGYRLWLSELRTALAPIPVRPTALPSWLKRPEFTQLAKDCGGFVLQVHCVAPPARRETLEPLADSRRAMEWAERAARIGVPFRVALPTYTYLVAFDSEGRAAGISAEAPAARWSKDLQPVRWEADPADLAQLVHRWTQDRPGNLSGLIWYRLPVEGDALNWRWPTLSAVMQGRTPTRRLRVEATSANPAEIVLVNDGEYDEPFPVQVEARWSGAALVAADGLGGYEIETEESHAALRLLEKTDLSRLPPGSRRPIAWIRCETPPAFRFSFGEARAGADRLDSDGRRP